MAGFSPIDRELFKEQVRSATDLARLIAESGVALKPAGSGRMKACCPFHHEKTPSFTVNGDVYHCFGCGEHGDCFSFLMKRDGLTFPEAVEALANRAGIQIPEAFAKSSANSGAPRDTRERLLAANDFARLAYHRYLRDDASPAAEAARAYLAKRSLSTTACADWGIGFAPDKWDFLSTAPSHPPVRDLDEAGLLSKNDAGRTYDRFRGRIMFPIRDANGKTVAFSGRILPENDDGKTGKYVNSPETPVFKKANILFGLDRAREAIRASGTALLCEGQIDTIRLHLNGFSNAVAPQGTAFTPEQAHILKRYARDVVLVLDGDTAGHKAALRDTGILLEMELPPVVALLPPGEDPDSFLLANGPDAFRDILAHAISPVAFLLSTHDLTTLPGVVAAKNALFELLGHVQSESVLDYAIREAAGLLSLSLSALSSEMRRYREEAARAAANAQRFRDQADAAAADQAAAALRDGASEPVPTERSRRSHSLSAPPHVIELARFLCNKKPRPDPHVLDYIKCHIRYDLIPHPVLRTVIEAYLENPDHGRDELQTLADDPDAALAAVDRLIVEPGPAIPPDQQEKAARDLLANLWLPHLQSLQRDATGPARVAIAAHIRALRTPGTPLDFLSDYLD